MLLCGYTKQENMMYRTNDGATEEPMLIDGIRTPMKQQRRYVLENFDCEKVQKCMAVVSWTWLDKGVPDTLTIYKSAERIVDWAIDGSAESEDGDYTISSGGLTARVIDGWLSLEFVLEEASGADDDVLASVLSGTNEKKKQA